jgi:hypothetical protein
MASYRPFRPAYARQARQQSDFGPQLERPPLPALVIDAVLRFHDEARPQGADSSLLRLSERRLREPEVRAALGPHAPRAAHVAVLWNDREDEIIRVLEAA